MRMGSMELLLILVIAVVLFGGGKVAGLGKALGTSVREFKTEVHKGVEPNDNVSSAGKDA